MAVSIGRLRPDTQYDFQGCRSRRHAPRAAGGAVLLAELLAAEVHGLKKQARTKFFQYCAT